MWSTVKSFKDSNPFPTSPSPFPPKNGISQENKGKRLSNLKKYVCCKQSVFLFFQLLNKVKSWSGSGNDVAVGTRLGDLDGLLLLEDKETVKLCSCLLSVVVPAQFKEADRICTGLSHDTLWDRSTHLSNQVWPDMINKTHLACDTSSLNSFIYKR